jgi:hypothetical protein
MSLHINKFIDRIKAAESRSQRDVTLTINEARDLHADITKLLIVVQELQQQLLTSQQEQSVISVELDGGKF